MPEYVDQGQTVNAAIRVVADSDEGAFRKKPEARSLNRIADSEFFEDMRRELRPFVAVIPVIAFLYAAYAQSLEYASGQSVPSLSPEQRRDLLKFFYFEQFHSVLLFSDPLFIILFRPSCHPSRPLCGHSDSCRPHSLQAADPFPA